MTGLEYVAECRREGCSLAVMVGNQAGLEDAMDVLDGGDGCPADAGHRLEQVAPLEGRP